MKLRYQLLLAGAVTLLLPVVAYRSVQQMDTALRDSRAFELLQSAAGCRAQLEYSGLLPGMEDHTIVPGSRDLYAEAITHSITLDGYSDDWINNELPAKSFVYANNKSTQSHESGGSIARLDVRLAVSDSQLHLFIDVKDDRVIYHNPGPGSVASEFDVTSTEPVPEPLANGDHLVIFVPDKAAGEDKVMDEIVFRAIAPGPVYGQRYASMVDGKKRIVRVNQYRGAWTATNDGYQLELSLPLPDVNSSFGFALVDIDSANDTSRDTWVGTVDPRQSSDAGVLVYQSQPVEALLDRVVASGSRARLFDTQGRLRADVNRLYETPANPALLNPASTSIFNALLYRFFEWVITNRHGELVDDFPLLHRFKIDVPLLKQNLPALAGATSVDIDTSRVKSYINLDRDHVMGQLQRISGSEFGELYFLYETNEATTNAFTSSAMVRLFSLMTLVSMLVAGSLFFYSIWLSWRIRRLSHQARSAVGGDGRIQGAINGSDARDEIGELSRSLALLVERSAGYTRYLESLASRLSHELRTPLSVVQTSLENIELEQIDSTSNELVLRAQSGAKQLSALIRSMSEATRLEQTVMRSEYELFDAAEWLTGAISVYNDIYAERHFTLRYPSSIPTKLEAVPELLQQALDKLISNAVDFSPQGSEITIIAGGDDQMLDVSVINVGAQIDLTLSDQLFEPMFSVRTGNTPESHLGLGLYIVKLISDSHGGRAYARNVSDTGADAVQIGFTLRWVRSRR